MPSCSDELMQTMRDHFPEEADSEMGMDMFAQGYLFEQGYVLTRKWEWIKPSPIHRMTIKEGDCIDYLAEDWDFGGMWMKRLSPTHIKQPKCYMPPLTR